MEHISESLKRHAPAKMHETRRGYHVLHILIPHSGADIKKIEKLSDDILNIQDMPDGSRAEYHASKYID